jgi:acyl-CoA thioester hydrolase
VRDEWLALTLRDDEAVWDYVIAHVSIDFRHEVRQADDDVIATCRLERIGTSSVRTREEIRRPDGTLAAEASAVLVARDREAGGSRAIAPAERAAFEGDFEPAA